MVNPNRDPSKKRVTILEDDSYLTRDPVLVNSDKFWKFE